MTENRFWMIGLLLIMAVICSAALAFVNAKTAPIIERQNELRYKGTVLDVFDISCPAEDDDTLLRMYADRIAESDVGGLQTFEDVSTGKQAIMFEGSGFQGALSLIVSLDGKTIGGFKVVSQVETPGLGARITEESFQESFIGKDVTDGITMTRSGSAGPSEFDAITGATETSRALERILNNGLKKYFAAAGQ